MVTVFISLLAELFLNLIKFTNNNDNFFSKEMVVIGIMWLSLKSYSPLSCIFLMRHNITQVSDCTVITSLRDDRITTAHCDTKLAIWAVL